MQRFPGSPVFESGTVYNVVARIRGSDSTGAIALDAHYDSGATAPGASDCGSCVVTLLETARILKNQPSLKNDLIFVFTDGEENGMLGAGAFVKEHPWAKDIRLAINFEAMGSDGPSLLYSTSQNNNTLIKEFVKAVPHPFASSFFSSFLNLFSAQRLGCDLEEYMDSGSAGLGFFYGADTPAYHTDRDSIEVIDPRSIQHQGSYAVGLARHFGKLNLSNITAETNAVYFNILPGVVVSYSQAWVIPQMLITGLLLIAVVIAGIRRSQVTLKGISFSIIAFVLSIISSFIAVNLVWWVVQKLNPNLQILIIGNYQSDIYQAAFIALTIAVMSAFYTWLLTKFHLHDLAYLLDADTNKSFWISSDKNLDNWTSQFFTDGTNKSQVEISPFRLVSGWKAPAPNVSLEPPEIAINQDIVKGNSRKLQLQLNTPRQADNIQVQVKVPGEILNASINGKLLNLSEFSQNQRSSLNFVYHGLPSDGISLTLSVNSAKPIEITLRDYSNGLPSQLETKIKKRTDAMMSAPMGMKDPTIVSKTFVFPQPKSKVYSGFPQRHNRQTFQFVA